MKRKDRYYTSCAELIKRVTKEKGDERASKCGYDLFMGLVKDNINDRHDAWIRFLGETDDHTDEERDGIWVPAIPYAP